MVSLPRQSRHKISLLALPFMHYLSIFLPVFEVLNDSVLALISSLASNVVPLMMVVFHQQEHHKCLLLIILLPSVCFCKGSFSFPAFLDSSPA